MLNSEKLREEMLTPRVGDATLTLRVLVMQALPRPLLQITPEITEC